MSVLEKKGKGKLDDTVPLKCIIESFLNIDGHTEFIMKVQRGPNIENSWEIQHRYNDFAALNALLTANAVGFELPLPPKKAFGNMDSTFLHERRLGLQKFMDLVLSNSLFCHHLAVKKFLDPRNYSDEIENTAQQQAAMFFRSDPNWELQENLKEIGWRVRKTFFIIKSKGSPKNTKHLLTWAEHGPDMVLDHETALLALLRQMSSIQHPFIYPVTYASCTEKGSTIVRPFYPTGSLRDVICKGKPVHPRLKKYGNRKARTPLGFSDIKRIGRQVLEALRFLRDKGWPYGHLHAGNVVIEGENCKLLDIENGILGVPSLYRSFLIEHKSVKDLESVDVYCFGHLMYEITFGDPLDKLYIDEFPENCPPIIQPILHSILSSSAIKSGLPTLDDLVANPFFADVTVRYDEKPSFKVNKLKDSLKLAKDAIEARLKDEQKKLRKFYRLSKARSDLLSEEEKKKRKKSNKKKTSTTTTDSRPKSPPTTKVSKSTKSSSAATPAAPPPPAPAPPPASVHASKPPPSSAGRGALLSSISDFSKGGLKKCDTNDRSKPKV